jgi:L-lactate utilization protein LutB
MAPSVQRSTDRVVPVPEITMTSVASPSTAAPDSLGAYLDRFVADTLDRCTRCGKCYEACPMIGYAPELAGAQPKAVVEGLLPLLSGESGSSQAVAWVKVCTQSATCIDACPEGINAMLMLRVARMGALGSRGGPAQMKTTEDPLFFRRIEAFAATQFSEDEIQAWHRADPKERNAS